MNHRIRHTVKHPLLLVFGSSQALGNRVDADTARNITYASLALTTASVSATIDGSSK